MIGHLWEPKLVGRDLGVTHAHVTCVSEAAKVMQESTDDKMSCFVVAVVAGVTPGIYIREGKEGRKEGRGGEQFSCPGANSPVHCMNNTTTDRVSLAEGLYD